MLCVHDMSGCLALLTSVVASVGCYLEHSFKDKVNNIVVDKLF